MRILLIGHNGQVGWQLQRTLACLGVVIVVDRSSTRVTLDLRDESSIRSTVKAIKPDLIVNAAAYTAVDRAETDVKTAEAVNALAPGILAQSAAECGAALVHYSTDYVFPGNASQPYLEDDQKGPINVYGETKLRGEQAIQEVDIPHLILRTSWVYGGRGKNFLLTMLRLMKERDAFGIVDDQVGSPTPARQIAEATALMVAKSVSNHELQFPHAGVFHLTSSGETTWYGFARKIQELGIRRGLLSPDCASLSAIESDAFRTDAVRPQYSVLNNDKLYQRFGLQLPGWSQSLELCLNSMVTTRL
ncbi:MAG TPA: dTDP-4-dehydrorhamnose reductase [Crenotrichaceae bacterium]|nr:dTDP-4-dehydrorhamnose reductase [Crenotrichaceae bacterium]